MWSYPTRDECDCAVLLSFLVLTSDTGLRQPLSLELSDTKVYAPKVRARLGHGALADVRLPGKRYFEFPWREACPPNRLDDKVDSDQ